MKRTTKHKRKLLARVEIFEQRLCMATDLPDLSIEMDPFDSSQAAEYSEALIIDQPKDSVDESGEIVDPNKEIDDTVPDDFVIPYAGDDADNVELWFEDRVEFNDRVEDDFELEDRPGDPDSPISFPPVARTPDEERELPGDLEINVGQVPPNAIDPPSGSTSQAVGTDDGKGGSHQAPQPKPTRPIQEIHQPAVQQSPPLEFIRGSVGTVLATDSRNLAETNKLGSEWTSGPGTYSIASQALHDTSHSLYDRPALTVEMQRFSSIEMTSTVFSESALEPAWADNSLTLRSSSSEKVTSSGSQRYFVSRHQVEGDIAKLRDSYSDPSVQHVADEGDGVVFDEIRGAVLVGLPLEQRLASGRDRTVAAVLTGSSFLLRDRSDIDEAEKDGAKNNRANPTPSAFVHDAVEPQQQPPKHRTFQRLVGLLMAGALISLQETSRILRNQNDEERTLHLTCVSTLMKSSNS